MTERNAFIAVEAGGCAPPIICKPAPSKVEVGDARQSTAKRESDNAAAQETKAFFRGLVTAACISGCIWIAAGAIAWAIIKGHFG